MHMHPLIHVLDQIVDVQVMLKNEELLRSKLSTFIMYLNKRKYSIQSTIIILRKICMHLPSEHMLL